MKFAPIVPTPIIDYIKDWDYHMVLAHKLEDYDYCKAYQEIKGFKIFDNGVAEGAKFEDYILIGMAHVVGANEIVCPDVMHDNQASIEKLVEFMRRDDNHTPVMAVMQATNWIEFNRILDVALELEVASVALPKLLYKHLGSSARLVAAEIVRRENNGIPIHCLGCSRHLSEAKDLARQGIVRGIDSAAPVVIGCQDRSIAHARYDWEQSHSAIPNFWSQKMTNMIGANLVDFNRWCETPSPFSKV